MSTHESNDLQLSGYFLPEESQQRLARLSEHIDFLSRLAQPRTRDEELDAAPEVAMAELATCLALLAEQADLVLETAVWRPRERSRAVEAEAGAEDAGMSEALEDTAQRFTFGVTLDQIDALDRLVQAIAAHGDVLAAGGAERFDEGTVPTLAQAICDGADALREFLDQIEAQALSHGPRLDAGVREPRAVYGVCPPGSTAAGPRLH